MTGSMYASVAGLRAHMQKLTVIGNNVANVNTAAYKKQRTVFRDSVYSMYSSGSNGSEVVGGMNPSQLGYGSLVASIDLDMSSATYNPGNPMDCAIVGDGFFLAGTKDQQSVIDPTNPESFKSLKLTRVGDFEFKADGYLSDGQGNVIYGFQCVGVEPGTGKPIISDQLVPLRKPKMEKAVIQTDTGAVINPGEDGNYATGIFDAEGNLTDGYEWSYTVRYPVNKQAAADGQDAPAYIPVRDYDPQYDGPGANNGGTGGTTDGTAEAAEPLAYAELESISIDKKTGCITANLREGGEKVTIGYLALGVVTNPNGVNHTGQSYYECGAGAGDLRITMLGGKQAELGITNVNGELQTPAEDDDGNQTLDLPELAQVTSAGDVQLMTGFLEAPNVDLATEITELITTQRGYQANTRIVTVTDSMLEELVNMKR